MCVCLRGSKDGCLKHCHVWTEAFRANLGLAKVECLQVQLTWGEVAALPNDAIPVVRRNQ